MLDWSGFLINSHDPLRCHVLKHIRQNSLTSLRYSMAEQGKGEVRKEFGCNKRSALHRMKRTYGVMLVGYYALLRGLSNINRELLYGSDSLND